MWKKKITQKIKIDIFHNKNSFIVKLSLRKMSILIFHDLDFNWREGNQNKKPMKINCLEVLASKKTWQQIKLPEITTS